ncbi:hypothetical protein ABZX40_13565 [Streptomyces sp. NPDC004610]|uniref:hypothetical protein n=1 Tax=unclassified Streptomyces TaxID=2593676 RepID=UPI0033B1338F
MAASKTSARAKQFPAKAGEPETEVEERSTDGSDGMSFVKQFAVGGTWTGGDAAHEANAAAVASEAIQRGLHPRGSVSFDGATDHDDGVSTVLTYSVETVPASIDHTPQDTATPHDVIKGEG